jgi:ABC-2 type transport system permease protein
MSSLAGTGTLARLALRLDRIRLAIWILAVTGVTVGSASAFLKLYPTVQSRLVFSAGIAGTPALRALTGPPFDLSSIGGLTAWRVGGMSAVLVGLMSLLAVVRHTRADEEAGRLELVGAAVVGRRAPLTAALLIVCGSDLMLGVLVCLGLIGLGLPATGALALGLAFTSAGWMFAAIGAVAAQLVEGTRAASGISVAALGLSFVLRAIGDSAGQGGPRWLSWLSPIGWTQQVRPFASERWWVFGLAGIFVIATASIAYILVARRDLGAGLLPPRLGPAEAAPRFASPLALAWRLQRGSLFGWTAGFIVVGAAFGTVADSVKELFKDNPPLQRIIETMGGAKGIVDAYLSTTLGILGLVASAYAIQAALRLRSEEVALRAEPILATRVGRLRWASSHLFFAVAGPALLLGVAGLAAGVTHGAQIGSLVGEVPRLMGAAMVQLPAVWVIAGIAVLLFGLVPRFTIAAWGALVVCLLLAQLGPILKLAGWAMDLSPFTHLPRVPGGTITLTPLMGLTAVAAALVAAGLAGFRLRDLASA